MKYCINGNFHENLQKALNFRNTENERFCGSKYHTDLNIVLKFWLKWFYSMVLQGKVMARDTLSTQNNILNEVLLNNAIYYLRFMNSRVLTLMPCDLWCPANRKSYSKKDIFSQETPSIIFLFAQKAFEIIENRHN